MTLPASRNTTYAAGSQVKSADLNAIQDCIVGMKKPSFTRLFWPRLILNTVFIETDTAGFAPVFYKSNAAGRAYFVVPAEVGDHLLANGITMEFFGDGAVDNAILVTHTTSVGSVGTTLNAFTLTNTPAAWTPVTFSNNQSPVMVPGAQIVVSFNVNAANLQFGWASATFDHP